MSVQELSHELGISKPKAYELVKSEGFPSIQIGRRIVFPPTASSVGYPGKPVTSGGIMVD